MPIMGRLEFYSINVILFMLFVSRLSNAYSKHRELNVGPKIISLRPQEATVLAKGHAIFECQVLSYPLSQIVWKKNNKKLNENNKKFKITHGSNLSILRVTDVNNSINVTCVAENANGVSQEATAHLSVVHEKDRPKQFPLVRITNPKSVEPDNLFKIDCNVTSHGVPLSNLVWYQSNKPINFENSKYFSNFTRLDVDTYRYTLYVKGLSLSSDPLIDSIETDFSCLAINSYGTSIADTSILIRNRFMPPIFVAPKRSVIELEYGASANITCLANGMPRPRVKWLEAKPETPIGLSVSTIYSNSIEIEWRPGGLSDVLYYVVKYRLKKSSNVNDNSGNANNNADDDYYDEYDDYNEDDGLLMDGDSKYEVLNTTSTKLKVGSSLKPFTLYEFRVSAVNLLGKSPESKPLIVRTAATKPGLVKNIRYTYEGDDIYVIKCDDLEDSNGNLLSYKIYYTDQVTNPIRNWNTIQIPADEMPYKLKLKPLRLIKRSKSLLSGVLNHHNNHKNYYIRVSAVNLELGEGPYSNIIHLKKPFQKFEAPLDFHLKNVTSTHALLKWNYDLNVLLQVYKHMNDQRDYDVDNEEILRNFYFELYLKEKTSSLAAAGGSLASTSTAKLLTSNENYLRNAFKSIQAIEIIHANTIAHKTNVVNRFKKLDEVLRFEYNLTGLMPNTNYMFVLAARIFNMESLLTSPVRFTTMKKQTNQLTIKLPGEPQDFKVVKVTATTIELEWKAPRREEQSTGNNIKGYEIHYYKVDQSGNEINNNNQFKTSQETQILKRKTNDVKKLKYTLTDLEPNSLYKIQIFAYNKRGDGQRSNPLLVNTLDASPNKPENIRSEIRNDVLLIKWDAPESGAHKQELPIVGYVIYFNNEKYEVDGQTNQITFPKAKWDYERQYEFKISAKSSSSSSSSNSADKHIYGQEADFLISTHTNQSKLSISLEKLTSTSVLIRWNSISFSSRGKPYYKLEYWPRSEPRDVKSFDRLNGTELQLSSLQANTDYIVEIIAISSGGGVPMTSEPATRHFRTLVNDIEAPGNLKVDRFEPDKIRVSWDQVSVTSGPADRRIKGYRVYYKELLGDELINNDESADYDVESSEEWKVTEENDHTAIILLDLNVNSDYAIKITAVDFQNNEGPESPAQTAQRRSGIAPPTAVQPDQTARPGGQLNDQVGMPQDVEIIEITSTAVKFAWLPPSSNSHRIKSFLLSFLDRVKYYRERNGSTVSYVKGITTSISLPARDDPTIKITWLANGLEPYTEYDFNISSVTSDNQQSAPVHRYVKTRPAKPARVDPPSVDKYYDDNTVIVNLGNASEINGPISKYWLVMVPLGFPNTYSSSHSNVDLMQGNNFEPRGKDVANLLRYSLYNTSTSNESSYITAEFDAKHLSAQVIVGMGEEHPKYGRFINRKLTPGLDYIMYMIAFTDESISNSKQSNPNMVMLADVVKTSLVSTASFQEGDLFSYSPYSTKFNTKNSDAIHASHNAMNSIAGLSLTDYYNILWVIGAIAAFIFIFIMIIIVSINVMQKRSKLNQNRVVLNTNGTTMRTVVNGVNSSATSSTTTTANLISSKQNHLDTSVSINNKLGGGGSMVTTTLIKKPDHHKTNQPPTTIELSNGKVGRGSSSSSSSSTTASPTTALLSCSVNNNSGSNYAAGSQSSSNTNTNNTNATNVILSTNGLLTTASPLRAPLTTNPSEGLYTSIEVTQKLLQQQLQLQNNDTSVMNMMMMNMINSGTTVGSSFNNNLNQAWHKPEGNMMMGTLGRNQTLLNSQFSINHYDPIEYRRIHYPTQALMAHPAVPVDELFQYIERLKAQNNAKFSLEYESIEPGQQFQWENSIMDLNRQKNRYANVIAYDHSRVILTKLPAHAFNLGPASPGNASQNNYSNVNSLHQHFMGDLAGPTTSLIGPGGVLTSTPPLPPPPPPPPGAIQPSPNSMATCSDYINANFIDGYRRRNCYIATQGPLPSTLGDFWRMIWEQNTSTIVMMTKLEERSRLKCDQYWPSKGTEVYDNVMQVTLVDYTELAAYSIRTFVIAPVNTYAQIQISTNSNNINFEMRREVKHFQYTAWPDHGVPDHPTQFLMFVRRVRNSNPTDSGPVVVHCSAGVGRTGCYIVIDTMLERLKAGDKSVDIYGHVTCLRSQRNYMVQTEEQYIFCYDAVLEAAQSGHTEVPVRALYQHLQRLLQISNDDPNSMLTEMEIEYKRLSNVKAPQSKFQSANLPANKFKNRLVNILPYEATRVVLQTLPNQPESSGSDYINANFIDGYKYKRAYIATQAPLVETVDDFWRMLWEHNSTIVVMLTKLREMGREKCAQYWPSERSIRYQYFVVDPIAEYNMSQYVLREFKVTDARDGQSRTVRQFQYLDWPEQGVPKSGESIIELIGQVHKTKEQFGQTGPITVHCSAGVGRTGVFITLGIVLERMRFEGVIDVYNTVKVLRAQRPAMVQTEDQYQFCYRAALEYLGSFDNFE